MTERRSERRSSDVRNDAQTRPDQTRVVLTVACGVCGSGFHPSHGDLHAIADARSAHGPATMDGRSAARFDGVR